MQLSIIIPALNEADCISSAVERAWALSPAEVIVSDGGSSDATITLAEQQGAMVVAGPPGRGQQLNRGAGAATGDLLLFLHADTWLEPHVWDQLAEVLANKSISFGAFRQRIEAGGFLYRLLEKGNAFRAGVWGIPYGDQGMFVRRELFDSLGGFPEVPIMEDLQFSRRVRKIAKPVLLDGPLHVSARRWRENGVIVQTARNWGLLVAEADRDKGTTVSELVPTGGG